MGTSTTSGRRVLIVEDDTASLKALRRLLTVGGYDTICAPTLADATQKLIWHPDIVLLDLNLPDGSGVELLRRLRRRSDPARVALVTAASESLIADAEALRPDTTFRKPLDVPALLAWLGAIDRDRPAGRWPQACWQGPN
jgi:two-component system OmpR family response regulator